MGALIDTSVLIEFERGRLNLEPHLGGRGQEEFFLSVITANVREFERVPGLVVEVCR